VGADWSFISGDGPGGIDDDGGIIVFEESEVVEPDKGAADPAFQDVV
jgi:hypothetical protein